MPFPGDAKVSTQLNNPQGSTKIVIMQPGLEKEERPADNFIGLISGARAESRLDPDDFPVNSGHNDSSLHLEGKRSYMQCLVRRVGGMSLQEPVRISCIVLGLHSHPVLRCVTKESDSRISAASSNLGGLIDARITVGALLIMSWASGPLQVIIIELIGKCIPVISRISVH